MGPRPAMPKKLIKLLLDRLEVRIEVSRRDGDHVFLVDEVYSRLQEG